MKVKLGMRTTMGGGVRSPILDNLIGWYRSDASGKILSDGAAQFTAANSESLSVASNSSLEMGDIDFTIAGWVYFDALGTGASEGIIGKWQSGGQEYLLYRHSTTKRILFTLDNGSASNSADATTYGALSVDRWYFVVGQYQASSDTITVSVNLTSDSFVGHTGGAQTAPGDKLALGEFNGVNFLDGRLDSFGIWKEHLDEDALSWLFNNSVGRKYIELGESGTGGSGLLTNLISWWELDELSGSRVDLHGSNNLTDNNTVTSEQGVTGVAADHDGATEEHLYISDNANISMGSTDMTVAGWFLVDSEDTAGTSYVAKDDVGSNREYGIDAWKSGDRFRMVASNDGSTLVTALGDNPLPSEVVGQWVFVVGWYDLSAETLYIRVNDVETFSDSLTGGIYDGTATLKVGKKGNNTAWDLDGRSFGVCLWKRVLTSAEITWLYNNGEKRTFEDWGVSGTDGSNLKTNLIAYWPMNEFSGQRNDVHGTNHLSDANTTGYNSSGLTAIGEVDSALGNNSVVASWLDQSGNSNDLVETTASRKPVYIIDVINGRPVIRFDGTDDRMFVSLQLGAFSIYGVWRSTFGGSGDKLCYTHNGTGDNSIYLSSSDSCTIARQRSTVLSNKKESLDWANDSTFRITSHIYDGTHAGHKLYENGSLISTSACTSASDPGTSSLIASFVLAQDGSDGFVMPGDYGIVLIYNVNHSDEERQRNEKYLSWWSGIALS